MNDTAPSPTPGRIVMFEEGDLVAPAMVTKVEEAMDGVVPAVSLTVFPPDSAPLVRSTVPHNSTFEVDETSSFWYWPERV